MINGIVDVIVLIIVCLIGYLAYRKSDKIQLGLALLLFLITLFI